MLFSSVSPIDSLEKVIMSNTFGTLFRVTSFGESHGPAVGVVIDGCPPGHFIDVLKIQAFLDRRRPGQNILTSPRKELDRIQCVSGLEDGVTLGTPITLLVENKDRKTEDYKQLENIFRPSHADYTTQSKFGLRSKSGGGRASARETLGRVAAASVAEQILTKLMPNFKVIAYVESIKNLRIPEQDPFSLCRESLCENWLVCPDEQVRLKMEELIIKVKNEGDSVGGVIRCFCLNPPVGLGEPVFDKLEADLAKAMMSLPATKGFEIGEGFSATEMLGSEHNDAYTMIQQRVRTKSNHSGGIQGGISNGEVIATRIAFKPVATIFKKQETVNNSKKELEFTPHSGRHDPCVLPRAVPIVEAMMLLVLMDHYLRQSQTKVCSGEYSKFE